MRSARSAVVLFAQRAPKRGSPTAPVPGGLTGVQAMIAAGRGRSVAAEGRHAARVGVGGTEVARGVALEADEWRAVL